VACGECGGDDKAHSSVARPARHKERASVEMTPLAPSGRAKARGVRFSGRRPGAGPLTGRSGGGRSVDSRDATCSV